MKYCSRILLKSNIVQRRFLYHYYIIEATEIKIMKAQLCNLINILACVLLSLGRDSQLNQILSCCAHKMVKTFLVS